VDSNTRGISFVAKLSLIERFPRGASLRLPLGITAQLVPVSQIAPAVSVVLVLPDSTHPTSTLLTAGDTIDAERKATVLDQVAEVAQQVSKELQEVLHRTHETLRGVDQMLAQANGVIRDVRPSVESTLVSVSATMGHVNTLVQRLDPGLADSVSTALALSTRVLLRLDSLAAQASEITAENRADVRTAVGNLTELTRQLNHLTEEVSRRPYRLLTGVKPLPTDSLQSAVARDSTQP